MAQNSDSERGSPRNVIQLQAEVARLNAETNATVQVGAQLLAKIETQAAEIQRLKEAGPLWIQHAIAKMRDLVDLTDPNDPIGAALTLAGLDGHPRAVPDGERREVIELSIDDLLALTRLRDLARHEVSGAREGHPDHGAVSRATDVLKRITRTVDPVVTIPVTEPERDQTAMPTAVASNTAPS